MTGLSLPALAAMGAVLLLAGVVRGFSGFGFSMVAVTVLSMFLPPSEIIPMVMLLEVAASLHLLIHVAADVDWRALAWLSLGMLCTTPLGVRVLATVAPEVMRGAVSFLVLLAALALLRGWRTRHFPGRPATVAVGALSGFLNGVASIAGPPVIVFFLSSPAAFHVSRASLIAFFLLADLVALLAGGAYGLVTPTTWARAGAFLVPVAAGIFAGHRAFRATAAPRVRTLVLLLLIGLSLVGLGRAVLTG